MARGDTSPRLVMRPHRPKFPSRPWVSTAPPTSRRFWRPSSERISGLRVSATSPPTLARLKNGARDARATFETTNRPPTRARALKLPPGSVFSRGRFANATSPSTTRNAPKLARACAKGGVCVSVSRSYDPDAMLGAFEAHGGWKLLRDGRDATAAKGWGSTAALAAGLYAWRRV